MLHTITLIIGGFAIVQFAIAAVSSWRMVIRRKTIIDADKHKAISDLIYNIEIVMIGWAAVAIFALK